MAASIHAVLMLELAHVILGMILCRMRRPACGISASSTITAATNFVTRKTAYARALQTTTSFVTKIVCSITATLATVDVITTAILMTGLALVMQVMISRLITRHALIIIAI